jgi:hypothetical protein
MSFVREFQFFCIGIAVSLGCLSWLSTQVGGPGHLPRLVELPGIALTALLDQVPETIRDSELWPNKVLDKLEALLDNYECPSGHEYRLEIVNHSPVILRLRGFLPPGEATHLLKLSYNDALLLVIDV